MPRRIEIVKRRFSLPLFIGIAGIVFGGLVGGFILLTPMSTRFVRYLFWRLTPEAAASSGSVKVGDADIHYFSYGQGPVVLLLHGGLSNRLSWFSQLPWLVASGRRVVLLDTRGHGHSGLGGGELTYRLLASDSIKVLDRLNIRRADVVGWSDGGNTALMLGRYWPQRVRRLVVISANFNPSGLTPEARQAASEQSRGLAHWISRWWTGAEDRTVELEARIKRMWQTRPNLRPADLQQIVAPTLVIVGEMDDVSIAHARQLAQLLSKGSLAVIPGGHATPVTQSRRVDKLLADFLEVAPQQ
jgi:pimeloyl-ACP methyl ester carboxylesterase